MSFQSQSYLKNLHNNNNSNTIQYQQKHQRIDRTFWDIKFKPNEELKLNASTDYRLKEKKIRSKIFPLLMQNKKPIRQKSKRA